LYRLKSNMSQSTREQRQRRRANNNNENPLNKDVEAQDNNNLTQKEEYNHECCMCNCLTATLIVFFSFFLLAAFIAGRASVEQREILNTPLHQYLLTVPRACVSKRIAKDSCVFKCKNFITPYEADHIRKTAFNTTVNIRISPMDNVAYTRQVLLHNDPVLATLETRIALWTHLPHDNGEFPILHHHHEDSVNKTLPKAFTMPDKNNKSGFVLFLDNKKTFSVKFGDKTEKIRPFDAFLFRECDGNEWNDVNKLISGTERIKGMQWLLSKWIRRTPFRIRAEFKSARDMVPFPPTLSYETEKKKKEEEENKKKEKEKKE